MQLDPCDYPFTKGLSSLFVRAAIVSVGLDVCEDVWLSFTFLKNACTYVHETLHTAFLCLSPETY